MTGHGRYDDSPFAFMDLMDEGSRSRAERMWKDMMTDSKPRQEELRLTSANVIPRDLSGDPIEYWVLATSQPEFDADGKVMAIMGSIADISHLKWVRNTRPIDHIPIYRGVM